MAEQETNPLAAALMALTAGYQGYTQQKETNKAEMLNRTMLAVKMQADQQKQERDIEEHKLNMSVMQANLLESNLKQKVAQLEYDNFLSDAKKLEMINATKEKIANLQIEKEKIRSSRVNRPTQYEFIRQDLLSGDPAKIDAAKLFLTGKQQLQTDATNERTANAQRLAALKQRKEALDGANFIIKMKVADGGVDKLNEKELEQYDAYQAEAKAIDAEIDTLTKRDSELSLFNFTPNSGFLNFDAGDERDRKLDETIDNMQDILDNLIGEIGES